ncbi:MAG TPA: histidine phosphatase family protein [Acholeplasmataceae bacterium]|jgi:uncharacterized phosphatase|nr:histidine phosphatase family protein [Acholeplasmataceae bacterium]
MTICLVRHGQTNWNINTLLQGRTDVPLNELGKKQAKAVGKYLQENDSDWDFLLASPLSRAYDTARIIAEEIGYKGEIILVPDAIERSFGDLEGKHLNQAMYDLLDKGYPGVETMEALFERAKKTITELIETYSDKKILLVSHAQFIKAALVSVDSKFDFRFPLKNSSLNYLEAKNGNVIIKDFNIVPKEKASRN